MSLFDSIIVVYMYIYMKVDTSTVFYCEFIFLKGKEKVVSHLW